MFQNSILRFFGNVRSKVSYFCGLDLLSFIHNTGYFEVDVGLPEAQSGMRIMAIADLNNDKLNDLITVDSTS